MSCTGVKEGFCGIESYLPKLFNLFKTEKGMLKAPQNKSSIRVTISIVFHGAHTFLITVIQY